MSVERISSIRRSNLSTWPSLSGCVRGRQCGKGESWASVFVIIRWALSPGASSAQYLGQAGRVSEGGMTSLSFSLSLYAFSNLSHEIPIKIYDNSRIVSLALPHLAYFSLSAFLIFICMHCFSRNLFFSVCQSCCRTCGVQKLWELHVLCARLTFSEGGGRQTDQTIIDWEIYLGLGEFLLEHTINLSS